MKGRIRKAENRRKGGRQVDHPRGQSREAGPASPPTSPSLSHSEAPPLLWAPPTPLPLPPCLDELFFGPVLRDHNTLSVSEPGEADVELPGGSLVGVLRQGLVQKPPHHLHHLAGGGQGPQEVFLHFRHTHIKESEVLACGGSRGERKVSAHGPERSTVIFHLILHPTNGKTWNSKARKGSGARL